MPSILYGTEEIVFEVVCKTGMKNTYLHVSAKGVVVKTNQTTSMRTIKSFVTQKSAWIRKHTQNFKAKKLATPLKTGALIYYKGQRYPLEINERDEVKKATLNFNDATFLIEAQKGVTQEVLLALLNNFYKQQSIEQISLLVEHWSQKMGVTPTHVGFRKAKTRWGSCSGTNRISLNYYLMKLPLDLVEYVVVHELAHITHKNHSAQFWGLVERYMPDYKEREAKIKALEKIV
jgi:predicted metal-dependent hydrolase